MVFALGRKTFFEIFCLFTAWEHDPNSGFHCVKFSLGKYFFRIKKSPNKYKIWAVYKSTN